MYNFILTCDGGSRFNPGPAASGFVVYETAEKIYDPKDLLDEIKIGEPIILGGEYLGIATNNQAEWKAVILGLQEILNKYGEDSQIQVFLDSELVIKQISGQYKVKHPELIPLHKTVKELIKSFKSVTFAHIYRQYNKRADTMVNQILDENK